MKERRSIHRLLAWSLVFAMLFLTVPVYAAGDTVYQDLKGVSWKYAEDGTLTQIQDQNQAVETAGVLMISAEVSGTPVTGVVSNGFDNVVVGHTANQYILLPEGIEEISAKAFYDFNYVKGVSIPDSVKTVDYNAFDVLGREINNSTVIYGGNAAKAWAKDNSTAVFAFESVTGSNFSVSAAEGGQIFPSGSYYVPDGVKSEGFGVYFSVEAASGYVIDTLTADGEAIPEAEGQQTYLLTYYFEESSQEITVSFRAGGDAAGEEAAAEEGAAETDAQEVAVAEGDYTVVDLLGDLEDDRLIPEAVAEGMDISDVYDTVPADNAGYTASMGVSTGDYYSCDGVLYEMVFGTNGTGAQGDLGQVFFNKAQVINYLYEEKGWVYGADYDLIRMFHFDSMVTGGNRKGTYDFHCAFAYKALEAQETYSGLSAAEGFYSQKEETKGITNNSSLFVQGDGVKAGTLVIENLEALCDTRPDGPQEATNFYGIGSAVLVDGGKANLNADYAETIFSEDTVTSVTLVEPTIVGGANPVYALASSLLKIQGGTLFTSYSGGHGPYSSLQGQIVINADENIVDENGVINTDVKALGETVLAARPGRFGWAERNTDESGKAIEANDYSVPHSKLVLDEEGIAEYKAENGDVTVVTTANSSGSILVTDSGGGVIVANKLSGTAYSTGSSGIYSMGGGSYVYVYNSRLESHIEPAMNSVGEGYIFAYNSEFSGPVGILSSGGSEHVNVYNSAITTEIDFEMDFYDMTDPNDPEQLATYEQLLEEVDADELVNSNYLMIFPLNGDDMSNFVSNWFEDRTQVPGKNGGNIAIISTTSPSGITVDSTKLTNDAYAEYGDEGVPNWLVAASGGETVVNFRNENSSTKWDLTGAENTTTELYGNLYCAAASGSGMWATGAGSLVANLENSQWAGSIENMGSGVTLNLDGESEWTVTGTCTAAKVILADGAKIQAADGCELTIQVGGKTMTSLSAGEYENVHLILTKNGSTVYDGIYNEMDYPDGGAAQADTTAQDSGMGGGDMGGMPGGDMGGMPGGGMGGGPSFATGDPNCTHIAPVSVTAVTWEVDDPAVAELQFSGREIRVAGVTPGSAGISCVFTCSDGSSFTRELLVQVEEAPEVPEVIEEEASDIAETEPVETVSEETVETELSVTLFVVIGVVLAALGGGAVLLKRKKK